MNSSHANILTRLKTYVKIIQTHTFSIYIDTLTDKIGVFMSETNLIQIRIDSQLKIEANEVFEKMGIDMPTAIRMFLKRTVLEQGLPFSTTLPQNGISSFKNNEALPKRIIRIPAKKSVKVPRDLVEHIIKQVPYGKLTRYEDIQTFFADLYGVEIAILEPISVVTILQDTEFPYWRVVSQRGFLPTKNPHYSDEQCAEKLKQEGFSISKGGANQALLRVDNYKDYLFDIQNIKIDI